MAEIPLTERIAPLHDELTAIRRDLHAHPELGFEETRTSELVASKLTEWGVPFTPGIGKAGLIATIRGSRPGSGTIGLRADMDALALTEQTGLPYASQTPGRMHACGHDGHTTMLLGAARYLSQYPEFAGTVHLIFQPAEEGRGGASAMIADGLFERFPCDSVYGMHSGPGMPAGVFVTKEGPMMAGVGRFTVTFHGPGGHGGFLPPGSTDLTIAQARFLIGIDALMNVEVAPEHNIRVRAGYVGGGDPEAFAVMPSSLKIVGTTRCFSAEMFHLLESRITELAQEAAASQRATATVELERITVPLINPAAQTHNVMEAARSVAGPQRVIAMETAVTGGEDFAFMMEACPGAFVFLGNGVAADGSFHNVHTPKYNFNDEVIPAGVAYWVSLVQQQLAS